MTTNANILKKDLIKALRKSLGIVTTACNSIYPDNPEEAERLRQRHYSWMKRNQKYREEVESLEFRAGDFVESQLFKLIKEGNPTAVIFYAKTKLKNRGYIERREIEEVNNPFHGLMKKVAERKKNAEKDNDKTKD